MKKEELAFLVQLARSVEDAEKELELAYSSGDVEKFNKVKSFIVKANRKIAEVLI